MRTSTEATPYSLFYRMEAILPVEVEIPSLYVLANYEVSEFNWLCERYEELSLIDGKRLSALSHVRGYQKRIACAFNKKVHPRKLAKGNLVLKKLRVPVFDPRGKFKPNWVSPYIIKKALFGGAAYLMDLDGIKFKNPINIDHLKKYFA